MIAKKAFFIVVTIGAIYLAYQFVQTEGYVSNDNNSSAETTESSDQLIALKAEVSDLQKQIDILNNAVESLNEQLSSERQTAMRKDSHIDSLTTESTANKYGSVDTNQKGSLQNSSNNTATAVIASAQSNDKEASSKFSKEVSQDELNKRIKQQSQLRAIAAKHQVASLSVLVD